MIGTLTRLSTGADPLEGVRIRTRPDGQVVAGVFPANAYDRLLLNGYELDVWMQPGVTPDTLRDTVASFYRQADPDRAVTLVLGAGNVVGDPDAGRAVLPVRRRRRGRAEDEPGQRGVRPGVRAGPRAADPRRVPGHRLRRGRRRAST